MGFGYRNFLQGLGIVPKAVSSNSEQGDLEVLSSDGFLYYHDGSINNQLIGANSTQVLTNKTIDADLNTILDIKNVNIASAAAIALNKLAATTINRALVSDASGFISPSATTSTEIGYVSGVTSSIQTQLNSKTVATGAIDRIAFYSDSQNLTSSPNFLLDSTNTAMRLGTTGVLSRTNEKFSLRYVSLIGGAAQSHASGYFQYTNSNNTAFSSTQSVLELDWRRSVSTVTDTGTSAVLFLNGPDIAVTGTYTNASLRNILIGSITSSGGGSLSISDYAGIQFSANSVNTGGRKSAILLGAQTGSVSNSAISDNSTFSGDWFVNSTNTNPSLLSGHLNLADQKELRLNDASGGQYVALRSPAVVASSLTFDLPSTDGSPGQALTTNGAGVLSFQTPAANLAVTSKTANYTALTSDDVILCNSSSGTFTISLPSAVGNTGKVFYIKKTDSSFNDVTIDPNGTETIDGDTTTTLNTQYEELQIVSDGSNWQINVRHINSEVVSFTPTGSWTGAVTYTGSYKRVGDSLVVSTRVATSGAPTGAILTFNIPSGLTIDTAKLLSTGIDNPLGTVKINDGGAALFHASVRYSSTTSVSIVNLGAALTYVNEPDFVTPTAPMTFASGDSVYARYEIPIVGWNG